MVLQGSVAHVRKQHNWRHVCRLVGPRELTPTGRGHGVGSPGAVFVRPLTHEVKLRRVGPGGSDVQLDSLPTSRRNSLK